MSNAAHAKTWQEPSLPNAGPLVPGVDATQLRAGSLDSIQFSSGASPERKHDMKGLSVTLRRLFDGGDQFLWGLSDASDTIRENDRLTRVDPEHELNRPEGADLPTAPSAVQSPTAESWLVIVESAENFLVAGRLEHLRAILSDHPRTLLIALDSRVEESPEKGELGRLDRALVDLSVAMGVDHVSLIAGDDLGPVVESLANVKLRDRAALVHLKNWELTAAAGIARVDSPAEVDVPDSETSPGRSLQEIASAELARRAVLDARITVALARGDRQLLRFWSKLPDRVVEVDSAAPQVLEWSALLALEGGRPFVFLSLQELLGGFGQLLQEICLKRAAVTLIVRPHDRSHDDEIVSSAALAGFRQLPHLSVISPKDSIELGQMLEWCANQDDPALVWLPDDFERTFAWGTAKRIDRGRAETLGTGGDVTILAWGPMVAAASMAAESLAELHIESTVINARFVQPIDCDEITRATQASLVTVVIDDADESGGFGSWILDHLIRVGVTQPIVVVTPPAGLSPHDRHETQRRCALNVVDRCRWLADPLVSSPERAMATVVPVRTTIAAPHVWFGPQGLGVEDRQDDQRQVLAQQFSPFIEQWVAEYAKVGTRDVYLWRWCLHGLNLTTLPSVTAELRASVCDTKLLSIILCVLLDDVADQHGGGALLDALLEMASCGVSPSWSKLSDVERDHGQVARAVWEAYWRRVATYPHYAAYEPVLRYDLLQFFNTMRYSHLVNGRPYLLNLAEHDVYTPHNMMMVSFATLDLMCSPAFPQSEVGALREMVWHAQCMGRIGNLLSTWKRELTDRDFTSGVFARALVSGDVTLEALDTGDAIKLEAAVRGGNHEAHFLHEWFEHRRRCHALAARVRSCDLTSVLEGHDRFFAMHLGSRGLI